MRTTGKKVEDFILDFLTDQCLVQKKKNGQISGCTTNSIAEAIEIQRANASSILNKLYKEGKIMKVKGRPVLYIVDPKKENKKSLSATSSFDRLIGINSSLKKSIQQAKAAILYPPHGLHSLILGPTGVGKTMFAELMYKYALENAIFQYDAPFVSFNCADYANNPQLLLSHLFGSKKGAFTGADKDRIGIVEKADGGILFLDEIHRLPPEGQEMLFYLIDKGAYTPLGDIDDKKYVEVLIIGATTEDKDSSLLSTFTRRIPMIITIPTLKDRTLKERFNLISEFFKMESKRISKEITVTFDVIKNLLLYECTGNLGQLKSDIQLGCANAFLRSVTRNKKKIEVYSTDFPNNVREGMLFYKKNEQKLAELIKDATKISFSAHGTEISDDTGSDILPITFYESIEKRIQELQSRDVNDEDIKLIMSFDVEQYFKKYIYKFENKNINKEELSKVVDNKIITIIEDYLDFASKRLKRLFSSKIFYGLCLHLNSSVQRIKDGKSIINHNLREIIEKYPEEYAVAQHISNAIESEMDIHIPIDEIGFLAMFLLEDEFASEKQSMKPIVVISMHGKSTASSMADVVNKLVGGNNTLGYDVNLEKTSKLVYEELKDLIIQNNRGAGVILLTDMGSLWMYAELISEETGIVVRAKDMVTTPVALNCARKSITEANIDIILDEINNPDDNNINYETIMFKDFEPNKENIIITLCTTGEGSAVKLKQMIEDNIDIKYKNVQIIPLAINSQKNISSKINKLMNEKKILAIIGTFNPKIYGIPFISVSELFMDNAYEKINDIINNLSDVDENSSIYDDSNESDYYNMVFKTLSNEIKSYDFKTFQPLLIDFISNLRKVIKINYSRETIAGLILHMACTLERLIKNEKIPQYAKKNALMLEYANQFKLIKELLQEIENSYPITFSDDEVCYILNYFILKN